MPTDAVVIVPAFRDAAGLQRTLDALAASPSRVRHHVVVAVDGPDAAVESVARRGADQTVVLPDNRGSYAARNAGLDAAGPLLETVDVVAFTDADCEPATDWIAEHRRTLAGAALSGGAIEMFDVGPATVASFLDRRWHLNQQAYVAVESYAATANLAVTADVARRFRFDPTRRSSGDREFCRRVVATGATIEYSPGAVVRHATRADPDALRSKLRRIGEARRSDDPTAIAAPPRRPTVRTNLQLLRAGRRAGVVGSFSDLRQLLSLERSRYELLSVSGRTSPGGR